jgi:hypothetical protein
MKPLLARKASWLLVVISAFAMPPALLAFIVSFVKPSIATQKLYWLSELGWRVGIGCIIASMLFIFGLNLTVSRIASGQQRLRAVLNRHRVWWRIGGTILAVLLISCFIPDFRSVRFSEGVWFSAKWGQITESTAVQYLWGAIRLSSVFILASGFNTGLFSLGVRDAVRAIEQ